MDGNVRVCVNVNGLPRFCEKNGIVVSTGHSLFRKPRQLPICHLTTRQPIDSRPRPFDSNHHSGNI
jgi:hypothetical protein